MPLHRGLDDRTRPASILSKMTGTWTMPLRTCRPWCPELIGFSAGQVLGGRHDPRGLRGGPGDIDFSQAQVGAVLDGFDARGQWVMARTAETIARAIVVPCLAVLQGDPSKAEGTLGEGLPSPVNCLVLDWKLRN